MRCGRWDQLRLLWTRKEAVMNDWYNFVPALERLSVQPVEYLATLRRWCNYLSLQDLYVLEYADCTVADHHAGRDFIRKP